MEIYGHIKKTIALQDRSDNQTTVQTCGSDRHVEKEKPQILKKTKQFLQ